MTRPYPDVETKTAAAFFKECSDATAETGASRTHVDNVLQP